MDFFEQQDRARRKTKWLVLVFVASTILTIFGIYFVISLMFCGVAEWRASEQPFFRELWHPTRFTWVAGYSVVFIVFGSLLKLLELRRGGKVIAEMLGGRLVQPNSQQKEERRLLNVVEEVCVASGIPVPHVYILAKESGINSFAAGNTVSDAIIAVTHGALKTFGRDELQGVIAHEVSHILNGDMRINTRLIGVLAGITTIAEFGRWLLRTAKSIVVATLNASGGTAPAGGSNPVALGVFLVIPLVVVGLAILIVGSVGLLCAQIVRAALSRQREFLADASAAQFTRNPRALVNALVKIRLHLDGSTVLDHHAEEASHFFFASALKKVRFRELLATHPTIPERIVKLDPSMAGQVDHLGPTPGGHFRRLESVMAVSPVVEQEPTQIDDRSEASAVQPVGSVEEPAAKHLVHVQDWIRSLPDDIRTATVEPFGAQALVFALLIDKDERIEKKQLDPFEGDGSGSLADRIRHLLPDVRALGPAARLPLMDLSLPALRQLSDNQHEHFSKTLRNLIMADGQVDVFEFTLEMALARHLERSRPHKKVRVPHIYAIAGVRNEVIVVLSTIAYGGHSTRDAAQHAFTDARDFLLPGLNRPMIDPAECSLDTFEEALKRLQVTSPPIKRELLKACALCVTYDGVVTPKEAELIRIVADVLDCHVPSLLASELMMHEVEPEIPNPQ